MSTTRQVLGVGPLTTGLNNQRLCIVGLIETARDRGMLAKIPYLIDFQPAEPNLKSIDISTAFDFNYLLSNAGELLTTRSADELITVKQAFQMGSQRVKSGNSTTLNTLRALRPAPHLQIIADQVRNHLLTGNLPTGLQLRVERDFRDHAERRFGKDIPPEWPVTPHALFQKIKNTKALSTIDSVWACCDEDDLIETKSEIKQIGHDFGLRVMFKSDLSQFEAARKYSRFLMSIIEFEIVTALPRYIGLRRSTFSNMLLRFAPAQEAWRYDVSKTEVVRAKPANMTA